MSGEAVLAELEEHAKTGKLSYCAQIVKRAQRREKAIARCKALPH
jgi:hypothetical protein